MGIFSTPPGLKSLIDGHVATMRVYADELASAPRVNRKAVIARIRKCASEVEHAADRIAAAQEARRIMPATSHKNSLPGISANG